MKSILLKTILFLIMIPIDLLAIELLDQAHGLVQPDSAQLAIDVEQATDSPDENDGSPEFDYTKHTDQQYKQLIVGIWHIESPVDLYQNQYYMTFEFGSTGMVKVLMYDINTPTKIYNEAYGYYDIKNGCISATFYNETRSDIGLANGLPYYAAFSGALANQQLIIYKNSEYLFNKI